MCENFKSFDTPKERERVRYQVLLKDKRGNYYGLYTEKKAVPIGEWEGAILVPYSCYSRHARIDHQYGFCTLTLRHARAFKKQFQVHWNSDEEKRRPVLVKVKVRNHIGTAQANTCGHPPLLVSKRRMILEEVL